MEKVFETSRLDVRRLRNEDLDALLHVYGDPDSMRWVGDGRPLSLAECDRWLVVTEENYRVRGYGMFAMVERTKDQVVGFCGLVHPGGQVEAEVKYALRRDCWGQGFATETVQALLDYAAHEHGLARVIATASTENIASHRVLEKVGMVRAEIRRNADGSRTQVFSWRAPTTRKTQNPAQSS